MGAAAFGFFFFENSTHFCGPRATYFMSKSASQSAHEKTPILECFQWNANTNTSYRSDDRFFSKLFRYDTIVTKLVDGTRIELKTSLLDELPAMLAAVCANCRTACVPSLIITPSGAGCGYGKPGVFIIFVPCRVCLRLSVCVSAG